MKQSARLDLNHMQTFVWVGRSGSFTRAAKALAMPKSTVSQHVRALEAHLGTRLIERTTRRLALTEVGKMLLSHCERVINEAEDAERAVTHYRSEPRGLLRVGVPVTFARNFLAPMLPGFCRKYPELRIQLVIPGKLDPVENLLDVVIRVGRLEDSSYVVKKLGEVPQGLYASRQYLRAHAGPANPSDLTEHSVIAISRDSQGARWRLADERGRVTEARFEPRITAADPVVAQSLAAAGLGIAILPEFLAGSDRKLARVLDAWRPPAVEFFALYPARELMPPKLRVFMDALQERVALAIKGAGEYGSRV